jgi:uncharacterized protein (TIGR03118 family)
MTESHLLLDVLEHRLLMAASAKFNRIDLVSDDTSVIHASHRDPNLINAWGLAATPTGPWWVADNGTGKSTLYDGSGNTQSLIVTVPGPAGSTGHSAPTGLVYNNTNGFDIATGERSQFIFSTEDGVIAAWSDGDNAVRKVDLSGSGAILKGLAIGSLGSNNYIYATDFHNNTVDVFDSSFHQVTLAGHFRDRKSPAGFAPFGIQNISNQLWVTYAKQDPDAEDDIAARGNGYVDVYTTNGALLHRFARRGLLNSPWGIAKAPGGFGRFKRDILIGNFGDGLIQAFDPVTHQQRGILRRTNNKALRIDGLWALEFGNDGEAGDHHELFFTAGPKEESHGQFGKLTVSGATTSGSGLGGYPASVPDQAMPASTNTSIASIFSQMMLDDPMIGMIGMI